MDRFKTYNATGIAPDGRLYAGDLNLFQDLVAALADLTQNVKVGSIAIGENGTTISHIGTGQLQISAILNITGVASALAGLVTGSFTTTARNAIVNPPHLLLIYNTTTAQFEYNAGTTGTPNWQSLAPAFGAGSISTSMLQDHAVTTIKLALKAVTATEIADNLKPSQSAIPTDESLRALGTTGDTAAAGNDARLSDQRTPLDGSVTGAKVNTALKPSGTAVDATEALRALGTTAGKAAAGNDSRFNAAVVATTIAGLGTATDGRIGRLRTGSTPYEFIEVIYDATYGKWVSKQDQIINLRDSGLGGNATDTAITPVSSGGNAGSSGSAAVLVYKAFTDAGLSLQLRLVASCYNVNSGTKIGAVISHSNSGDGFTIADEDEWANPTINDMHTFSSSSAVVFDTGWAAASVPATPKSFMNVEAAAKRNGLECRISIGTYMTRWVA